MASQVEDSTETKHGKEEFADRITRILIAFTQGMLKILPEGSPLFKKLEDLLKVLQKAIRGRSVPTGLAKEVSDYFERRKLEDTLKSDEKAEMKQLVVELGKTIQEMAQTTGEFGGEIGSYVEKIQKVETIQDLKALRTSLVADLEKVKLKARGMREELEKSRASMMALSTRLEQTEAQTLIDQMTNVYNRHAYDIKIGQALRSLQAGGREVCLAVIDIDHFKKFNDTYGHKLGDEILVFVAGAIRDTIRKTDALFRYGGEEFVVILLEIDVEQAQRVAEKIRARVESDYYIDKGQELRVTVSLGLTGLRAYDTEDSVFERADKALYESKNKGRNRLTVV